MAAADYRLCDKCDAKAFYDAELNYDHTEYSGPRYAGTNGGGPKLGNLGDWAVLCVQCSTRFRTAIVPFDVEEKP